LDEIVATGADCTWKYRVVDEKPNPPRRSGRRAAAAAIRRPYTTRSASGCYSTSG
jgi:hypothetical protein